MTQTRTASCACGQLSLEVEGDPAFVASCNCLQCQKRTGSVFGVSSYFPQDQVQPARGERKTHRRSSDAGRMLEASFCPECGSTVFWRAEGFPDLVGVAVGCFADPEFPAPTVAVWATHKHAWVSFPPKVLLMETQRRR
jgi:hypothetical protein